MNNLFKKKVFVALFALLIVAGFPYLGAKKAEAATYTENFDSYSTGTFTNGTGGWNTNVGTGASLVITTLQANSSPKSLTMTAGVASSNINRSISSSTKGRFTTYIYVPSSLGGCPSKSSNHTISSFGISDGVHSNAQYVICDDGRVYVNDYNGNTELFGGGVVINFGAWNRIDVDFASSSGQEYGRLGVNGVFSSFILSSNTGSQIMNRISITTGDLVETNYVDDVSYATNGDAPSDIGVFFSTHIETVTPADRSITATSTAFTFGVTGYVSQEDFDNGMDSVRVNISYDQSVLAHLSSIVDSPACIVGLITDSSVCGYFRFPITSSGAFSFSTTTRMVQTGKYFLTANIEHPVYYFFFGDLAATSTIFFVDQATGVDILVDAVGQAYDDIMASSTVSLDTCKITSFDLLSCTISLITPTGEVFKRQFTDFTDSLKNVFPIGYVTRFLVILLGTNSIQPPALTYTFGSSSPSTIQGKSISIQIWDKFTEFNSIRTDDGQNKGIWDIVMPYFNTIIAFAVLLVILETLLDWTITFDSSNDKAVDTFVDSDGIRTDTVTRDHENTVNVNFQGQRYNYNRGKRSFVKTTRFNSGKHKIQSAYNTNRGNRTRS